MEMHICTEKQFDLMERLWESGNQMPQEELSDFRKPMGKQAYPRAVRFRKTGENAQKDGSIGFWFLKKRRIETLIRANYVRRAEQDGMPMIEAVISRDVYLRCLKQWTKQYGIAAEERREDEEEFLCAVRQVGRRK